MTTMYGSDNDSNNEMSRWLKKLIGIVSIVGLVVLIYQAVLSSDTIFQPKETTTALELQPPQLPNDWETVWPFEWEPSVCELAAYLIKQGATDTTFGHGNQYYLSNIIASNPIANTGWTLGSAADTLALFCGWNVSDEISRQVRIGDNGKTMQDIGRYLTPPQ